METASNKGRQLKNNTRTDGKKIIKLWYTRRNKNNQSELNKLLKEPRNKIKKHEAIPEESYKQMKYFETCP